MLDSGSSDLIEIEGVLRQAGCMVRREPDLSPEALAELSPDLGIVDLTDQAPSTLRCLDSLTELELANQR